MIKNRKEVWSRTVVQDLSGSPPSCTSLFVVMRLKLRVKKVRKCIGRTPLDEGSIPDVDAFTSGRLCFLEIFRRCIFTKPTIQKSHCADGRQVSTEIGPLTFSNIKQKSITPLPSRTQDPFLNRHANDTTPTLMHPPKAAMHLFSISLRRRPPSEYRDRTQMLLDLQSITPPPS
jgi:hypothetical protein